MLPATPMFVSDFHSCRNFKMRTSGAAAMGSWSLTARIVFGAALLTDTMVVVSNCCSPRLLISLAMKLLRVAELYVNWKRQLAGARAMTAAASATASGEFTSGWAVFTVGLILSHSARECLARARNARARVIN